METDVNKILTGRIHSRRLEKNNIRSSKIIYVNKQVPNFKNK